MNISDLKKRLIESNIAPYRYNVDGSGRTDNRICICKNIDKWEVFFLERGEKCSYISFENETDACMEVLRRFHIL